MRTSILSGLVLLLGSCLATAQGTFTYDQQSSTNEGSPPYGYGPTIQSLLPSTGQSFTPDLGGIDFIRLIFDDYDPGDGLGVTISLNLRSGSITGPILGTTAPVTMMNAFAGTQNFFFPNRINLMPGTTYYFDLSISGGPWNTVFEPHTYFGGQAYVQGQPYPGGDYWFREGIYTIPEPSTAALASLGAGALLFARSTHRRPRRSAP